MATTLPDAVDARLRELPPGLRDHIERSRVVSQELAIRHHVDAELADIGTAAHDLARAIPRPQLLDEARRLGLKVSFVETQEPIPLHGPVAAAWLRDEDGYTQQSVLEATEWHTTGRPGMSDVAKIVFLGDKLDPSKVARFPFLEKVSELATADIDLAILEYLNRTIEYFVGVRGLVHPTTIKFRNELVVRIR